MEADEEGFDEDEEPLLTRAFRSSRRQLPRDQTRGQSSSAPEPFHMTESASDPGPSLPPAGLTGGPPVGPIGSGGVASSSAVVPSLNTMAQLEVLKALRRLQRREAESGTDSDEGVGLGVHGQRGGTEALTKIRKQVRRTRTR